MKVLFFLLACVAFVYSQHPSPCPDIFQYTTQGNNGTWSGKLTLDSEFPLSGVWIRLQLDKNIDSLETQFGEALPRDDKSYLIKSRSYNLIPGTPLEIPMVVRYPVGDSAPSVVGVRLNARVVCPATRAPIPPSKCPGVFSHELDKQETDRWHGSLTLQSEFQLSGVWLRVVLDRPAELLGNEFGEVKTTDNLSYLISNRNHTMEPGRPLKIGFWVKYDPSTSAPQIQTVRLNGRTVCGQIIAEDNNQ